MITIKECLKIMESGEPFSLKVISFDKSRKKGGQVQEYPEAILVQNNKKENTGRPRTKRELQVQRLTEIKKAPNHKDHYTRNIQILQDGHPTTIIKKIHPPLIIEFNGDKEVTV